MREIAGGTDPDAVRAALVALRALVDGTGPALVPLDPTSHRSRASSPGGASPGPAHHPRAVPDEAAVVLATSGSTGRPRLVALSADALLASAHATHERLGGAGRWLLALGIHYVAGWQVLVRSVLSGTEPVVLDTSGGFDATGLAPAVAALGTSTPRYASLVPTQLVRALRDPAATDALATLDAVLVGGAALPPDARARAAAAGIPLVTTYGMTETGGGCVYDGLALTGVCVAADDGARLTISGPTLALGYVGQDGALLPGGDDDGARFLLRSGVRWLRTADLGAVDDAGRVTVLGRADDAIVTGGVKVHPAPVERLLATHPGIAEAVVVGLPDPEWGTRVVAVVVPDPTGPQPDLDALRRLVTERLGAPHAPRALAVVGAVPRLGPGKIDRSRAATLAAGILAGP